MNTQKIFILLFGSIFALIAVIVFIIRQDNIVKEIDTNKDGKIDVWEYWKDGNKLLEKFDGDFDGKIDGWTYWNRKGGKIKDISIVKGEKSIYYYKKGKIVLKNGEKLLRQELDYDRTYRKHKPRMGKDYSYIKDGKVVLGEIDFNNDGKIDHVNYIIKDYFNRLEWDTDYDGEMDYFEYLKLGELQRIERDIDHDGKIDEVRVLNPETGEMELQ